jgi:hypothetical protein
MSLALKERPLAEHAPRFVGIRLPVDVTHLVASALLGGFCFFASACSAAAMFWLTRIPHNTVVTATLRISMADLLWLCIENDFSSGAKGLGQLATIINPAVVVHDGPSLCAAVTELRGAFKTTRLMIALNSCSYALKSMNRRSK